MNVNCSPEPGMSTLVQFRFNPEVSLADAEMSLHLAMFAVEGVFGRARVRLDSEYDIVAQDNSIRVDAGTEVGMMIVRIYTGLLLRELGEDKFEVARPGHDRRHGVQLAASRELPKSANQGVRSSGNGC